MLHVALLMAGLIQIGNSDKAEQQSSMAEHYACLQTAARSVDDGVSGAGTIAQAAIAQCGASYDAMINAFTKHMTPRGRDYFLDELGDTESRLAINAVLKERKEARDAATGAPAGSATPDSPAPPPAATPSADHSPWSPPNAS